jgi:hypothetical protein
MEIISDRQAKPVCPDFSLVTLWKGAIIEYRQSWILLCHRED